MTKQRFHIHQLSRLAFAQVTDWDRILRELEARRKQMFWSYKPLRSGAFNLLKAEDISEVQEIYNCVTKLAEKAGGARCASANVRALQMFENRFVPTIDSPRDNYMEFSAPGVDFVGAELIGGPHFSVIGKGAQTSSFTCIPQIGKKNKRRRFANSLRWYSKRNLKRVLLTYGFLTCVAGNAFRGVNPSHACDVGVNRQPSCWCG
jgi:hypothetical protein